MAAYEDLRNEFSNDALRNKVTVAVVVAAYNLLIGVTPTAAERAWAQSVIQSPDDAGRKALMLVLAANKDASVAAIQGASDATVQTNIDAVVDQLVLAYSGV